MNPERGGEFRVAERGMSLVELLVAMVVGLLMMAYIAQVLISANSAYALQEELARIQERGRFAAQFVAQGVRRADNWGCGGTKDKVTDTAYAGNLGTEEAITADDANDYDPAAATASPDPPAADRIVIRGIDPGASFSCDVAKVGVTVSGSGFVEETVFTVEDADGDGEPGLYRQVTNSATTKNELVRGIENLQARFGEDTDGDGSVNYYVPAANVSNWSDVLSVRVAIVARTRSDLISSPGSYSLFGTQYNPADERGRRVFTTTIGLRNRLQ